VGREHSLTLQPPRQNPHPATAQSEDVCRKCPVSAALSRQFGKLGCARATAFRWNRGYFAPSEGWR
jgi:hypothetical protein